MNDTLAPLTETELNAFVAALNSEHESRLRDAYPDCMFNWSRIIVDRGHRYAKLVSARPEVVNGVIVAYKPASAFGFIDLATGDIFKAAGWSKPAKGARGNIRRGDASNLWNGAFYSQGGGLHVVYLR